MNAIPFDTLAKARRLQASGVDAAVAAGMVDALVEGLNSGGFATTADVAKVLAAIDSLRTEMKSDIAALQLTHKSENELLRRDFTIKTGSMMVVAVGVILTAMRYLGLHS